jgi:hypothetical protein
MQSFGGKTVMNRYVTKAWPGMDSADQPRKLA